MNTDDVTKDVKALSDQELVYIAQDLVKTRPLKEPQELGLSINTDNDDLLVVTDIVLIEMASRFKKLL